MSAPPRPIPHSKCPGETRERDSVPATARKGAALGQGRMHAPSGQNEALTSATSGQAMSVCFLKGADGREEKEEEIRRKEQTKKEACCLRQGR